MKAKTIHGDSPEEIKQAFTDCVSNDFQPTLAFAFIPYKLEIKPYCKILEEKGIAVFGTSRFGTTMQDPVTIKNTSFLLLDISTDNFNIFYEEFESQSPYTAAKKIAVKVKETFKNSSLLVYSSNFRINFSNMLKGFTSILGEDVNLFGAVSGTDESISDGLVFTKNKQSRHALLALAFDAEKVNMQGDAFSGWKSVGTIKTITKSQENIVLEIDNKPAIDITMKYGGIDELPEDFFEATILVSRTMSMNFLREKGEPVTLIGLVLHDERGLITNANCPVGTKLQFALPPEFDVINETILRFSHLKDEVPNPDAVLLYNCMNRMEVLGPFVEEEINGIRNLWDAPLAGFMSNGEIGRAKNSNLEIHNCTQMCVVLKEKTDDGSLKTEVKNQ